MTALPVTGHHLVSATAETLLGKRKRTNYCTYPLFRPNIITSINIVKYKPVGTTVFRMEQVANKITKTYMAVISASLPPAFPFIKVYDDGFTPRHSLPDAFPALIKEPLPKACYYTSAARRHLS
ncbi:hypothetical protein EVAR_5926_1 [Eumeta japonica]|uniref:Uncharacterized protein n=1 Tax=Eumeta variegata TaxID=151549 RepID=A0A4C1TCA6_EUMVA|nr:hypothetical protein EVAR_5926_1 [Eumeta japonica]